MMQTFNSCFSCLSDCFCLVTRGLLGWALTLAQCQLLLEVLKCEVNISRPSALSPHPLYAFYRLACRHFYILCKEISVSYKCGFIAEQQCHVKLLFYCLSQACHCWYSEVLQDRYSWLKLLAKGGLERCGEGGGEEKMWP